MQLLLPVLFRLRQHGTFISFGLGFRSASENQAQKDDRGVFLAPQ